MTYMRAAIFSMLVLSMGCESKKKAAPAAAPTGSAGSAGSAAAEPGATTPRAEKPPGPVPSAATHGSAGSDGSAGSAEARPMTVQEKHELFKKEHEPREGRPETKR